MVPQFSRQTKKGNGVKRGDNAFDKTMWNRKDLMRVGNIRE
jgi:hypothetical protein